MARPARFYRFEYNLLEILLSKILYNNMAKNKDINITPSKGISIVLKMILHHHQLNQRRKENIKKHFLISLFLVKLLYNIYLYF